jgi:integrase
MGVNIRKRGGKWYVFVNYQARRKAKCVGSSRQVAEQVKRQLEAKLALGDFGFLSQGEKQTSTFDEYSKGWLKRYAELECKPSTVRSYEQLLRVHVTPRFGHRQLAHIRREEIKGFLVELSQATHVVDDIIVPRFSRNTLRLIVCALRCVLAAAVEDGIIESNPASRIGKFARTEKPARQASAMTRTEAEKFLAVVERLSPEWHPFFLAALRSGLRKGELIALKWGDIQFGESGEDPNRYILVQRNWSFGRFTTTKSKKSRRVDLSKQLRTALLDLRDSRLLSAMMAGRTSVADDLVFPSQAGTVIKPDNIVPRYMEPALLAAGLRHFRFHDLRHTFGSLLIQDGASLAYVKEQMGHSSIQITVDTYGHLIPGADIAWVDRLDVKTAQQPSATRTQQAENEVMQETAEVVEGNWLPPRDSNPDMLIQSQLSCR